MAQETVPDVYVQIVNSDIIVNQAGQAVVVSQSSEATLDSFSIATTISAIDGNGQEVYTTTLDQYPNYSLDLFEMNGNNLVLGLMSSMDDDEESEDANLPAPEVVSIDSTTGNTNWTLTVPGEVLADLIPKEDGGFYLQYMSYTEQEEVTHLAGVSSSGEIARDIVTSTVAIPEEEAGEDDFDLDEDEDDFDWGDWDDSNDDDSDWGDWDDEDGSEWDRADYMF